MNRKEGFQMKQYETFELVLKGTAPKQSEAIVDLEAVFSSENGNETKVPGFYAGDGTYKIRFYPKEAGNYTWKVKGILEAKGSEYCDPNPDPKAGMVRASGRHFSYEGGAWFYPFGTTVYALCHQSEELINTTMKTLSTAPFNKVRHCVFPKRYGYNHNEPTCFAFERNEEGKFDVNRPCYAFWDALEARILELQNMGIQSDLILFHPYDDKENWGLSILSQKENLIYLDYLLRRLAAIPSIWWSLANEYDLCFSKSMDDWYEIEEFIANHDPYHHLMSNHQCVKEYDFSRPNITHQSVQTTYLANAVERLAKFEKPLCYDEVCYEGNLPLDWGNISGWEMANRFWETVCSGAYCTHGEVFLAEDEVLWWAKGGILKGQSPDRIAYLKSIVEELPGPIEAMDGGELPPEFMEAMAKDLSIAELLNGRSKTEKILDKIKSNNYCGRIGKEVYLVYFGHHCNGTYTWLLPEDEKYEIDLVDMWDMTRTRVADNVCGSVKIEMPGKEGMALIAKKIK